ncbi:MAG: ribosome biogenesis GTP-binding protein YihA/YsxC [Gammaproteobacteria bacterium]|nr:ribosome biogenesis GTP-binding protein YihA/YsxC [Gammaproteobacteria bacterium]
MNNPFQSIEFSKSAPTLAALPPDTGAEVAFAGRSNAGKSSAINTITRQKGLARTSKTPGRTQAINFFTLSDNQRLVDLPGYGYAKVSQSMKTQWQKTMNQYLESRQSLKGLILLTDIRHPLEPGDQQLLNWCIDVGLPVHILLTKADKLSRGKAMGVLQKIRAQIGTNPDTSVSLQLFSALKSQGVEEVTEVITHWLSLSKQQ